ncbi:HNH endonuclease [Bacillus nitratireducens]|nr:HNH endonuclease [Bacillus nitratireducens]
MHIDHIVPLQLFGSNDASNFQLLCETCNTSKGARSTATSSVNIPFWNLD